MFKLLIILTIIMLAITGYFRANMGKPAVINILPVNTVTKTPTPIPTTTPIPAIKIIDNDYHVFQTFNNCGPAALSMAMSYYGIVQSQQTLGRDLRPYQNAQGDNDDKSVTLNELANKSIEFGLVPFHRPNGKIDLIKQFIALDLPVITRTTLKINDDIGHFRVIKGYDDTTKELIQDDSLQGHNLRYSYSLFTNLWQTFNYEYLVLAPPEKVMAIESLIGDNLELKTAWNNTVTNTLEILTLNPNDLSARLNLSIALYHTGDYINAVAEFEKVESRLPFRTLWYQIEPILAYYQLADYQKVFDITNKIFNNQNRAYSELYLIRGHIYQKQGNSDAAQKEFDKALLYNSNLDTMFYEALYRL